MYKLTTENTFIFQNKFYKQTDGCTMGGPLSVIMSDIFMTKLENDVVRPFNPPFYKRFVDDCITKRKRNEHDKLFELINNYHRNIKFTIEIQPTKFLDTKLINENGSYSTEVYRKETKLPVNWSSKTPKRYKRNAINGDLYRSYRISSNFNKEIELIRKKFTHADYPIRFTNSVIKQFQQRNALQQEEDDMIIPPNLFEEPKSKILIEIPYCEKNEKVSKQFIKKFYEFTNKFEIIIRWITKKVKQLFKLKDDNPYPACKIYKGVCTCKSTYIGETG